MILRGVALFGNKYYERENAENKKKSGKEINNLTLACYKCVKKFLWRHLLCFVNG